MASKADRFYFTNYVDAAEYACRAAAYLVQCLTNYDPENMKSMLESMHTLEHAADGKKHEMSVALAKAFVTPLDREDLASLSQSIDEVPDTIEEVLQHFYIGQIRTVLPAAVTFAQKLCVCCQQMKEMLCELENFKKSERLHALTIEINQSEEECDRFYLDAAMQLRSQCDNVYDLLAWREIFDFMEDCADACEHVADSVETIVMKNT